MKIKWQVEDGYVGKARPQYTTIPDEDFKGMSEEEREQYIEDWVQNEFENNISYGWEIIG